MTSILKPIVGPGDGDHVDSNVCLHIGDSHEAPASVDTE